MSITARYSTTCPSCGERIVPGDPITDDVVDTVLPIIAAEVRAAKAEALREAAERATRDLGWGVGGHTSAYNVRHWLRRIATEYETGD